MEDIILENAPNSIRAREIITKRQKELDDKLRKHEYNHKLKTGQCTKYMFEKSPGIHKKGRGRGGD